MNFAEEHIGNIPDRDVELKEFIEMCENDLGTYSSKYSQIVLKERIKRAKEKISSLKL